MAEPAEVRVGDIRRYRYPVNATPAGRRHVRVVGCGGRWATVHRVDPESLRKIGPRSNPEAATLRRDYELIQRDPTYTPEEST